MMNKLLLLCVFCATTQQMTAQSMLKVRVADNRPINVWLDGRYFTKRGTSVTVGDLPAGQHMLKIYSVAKTRYGKAYQEVIFHGKVNTYRDMITKVYYDPYSNEVDANDENIASYMQDHPQTTLGEWRGEDGGDREPYNGTRDKTGSSITAGNSPLASPVSSDRAGSLTEIRIDKLKKKVDAKKVDTEKMNELKDALKNETYTTGQVGVMMEWFGFESSKVDFAEWAYPNTVDKEIFGDLISMLKFEKYQNELEQFVKDKN